MRVFLWALPALCLVSPCAGQSSRTVTNKKHGFKLSIPRFLKEVPTQPDELQILAKFKGTKRVKPPKGEFWRNRETGKRVKDYPVPFELWVVRIESPGQRAPVTGGRRGAKAKKDDVAEMLKRHKNGGRNMEEFLKRRMGRIQVRFPEAGKRPLRNGDREVYKRVEGYPGKIGVVRGKDQPGLIAYTVVHEHEHYGNELFGLVAICSRLDVFEKAVQRSARSLRRLEPPATAFAKKDPYKGSELRHIPKRREIRARLVKGWYAEDTENFILITDMPNNTANRQLLREMLTDLEIMRSEFEKRFPPIQPLTVVSTVRVCNSYEGYLRYSSKPGTGGYWHPIAEELVLFNPVGKIKKQAWMRKVSAKSILYHEAMHQYFHYANGEMPPASWFNEGYGEYFGGAKTDRFQKKIRRIGKNDFRWQVIRQAQKDKDWPEIEKILPMTQQVFYSQKSKDYPVLRNYAFGWAFCYFLEQEREKPAGVRNEEWAAIPDLYLKNLRKATKAIAKSLSKGEPKGAISRLAIPAQRRAFKWTFGKTDFAKLQADWVAAMKSW